MNEQLLKIETILLDSPGGYVLLAGAVMVVMGLFLWLGGLRYLKVVSGMLGGGAGALVGSVLAGSFSWHPAGTIAASAAIGAIGAVLLQQLIILLVATLIFAVIFGGGYMEYALGKISESPDDENTRSGQYEEYDDTTHLDDAFHSENPFGNQGGYDIDDLRRTGELAERTGEYVGTFFEKIKAVFSEMSPTMSENAGSLVLWCVLGAMLGLVLAKLLKTIVMALCCSIVGTTSTIAGMFIGVIAKGTASWTQVQGHGKVLAIIFLSMVVFGWLFQMLTGRKAQSGSGGEKKDKE